jgi:tetratricopeptide (TPR) repeat protein
MKRVGFSFLIAWMMASLAFGSVAAQGPTPTPVAPVPVQILQFLADHIEIDIVALILLVIGGGGMWGIIRWLWRRFRPPPVAAEPFPFRIIPDPTQVLPTLLRGEGPLADHAIPYHPRVSGRNIQEEMGDKLIPGRYVLVKGKRGLGKTREAGILAEALCREGATVLALRPDAWLDVPASYPPSLPDRNLILFLDRLELHCAKKERPPVKEEAAPAAWPSFHERLRKTLDWFERTCGEPEIRVIATARDEREEWEKLGYKEDDTLWRRFALYDLPLPEDQAVVGLLTEVTEELGIEADAAEFPHMAARSDGTMRNVVENLRLADAQRSLTLDQFRSTLEGSYRDSYQIAVHRHPQARYIYDALDIMLQLRVTPFHFLVRDLAAHLWGGNILIRRVRGRKLNQALDYVINSKVMPYAEDILEPRDGQVEERGERVDFAPHLQPLAGMLLRGSRERGQALVPSLHALGYELAAVREWTELPSRLYARIVDLDPQDGTAYYNLGNLLYKLERYDEAEGAYRRAIELQPDYATAYNNLGNLLYKLERYDEAEGAYRRAIELQPDDAMAYRNRADALIRQGKYDEALADIENAASLQPDHPYLHARYGQFHYALKQYEDSARYYRQAIELEPDRGGFHFDRGLVLLCLDKAEEAYTEYERGVGLTREPSELEEAIRDLQELLDENPHVGGGQEVVALLMDALQEV